MYQYLQHRNCLTERISNKTTIIYYVRLRWPRHAKHGTRRTQKYHIILTAMAIEDVPQFYSYLCLQNMLVKALVQLLFLYIFDVSRGVPSNQAFNYEYNRKFRLTEKYTLLKLLVIFQ